jgi:hypothetical protein
MGDAKAAKLCNVIDTGNRENAYQGIYNAMLAKTGGTSVISLEDTKQAIMTALYSSKAEPKRVFGEGTMLDIFYETMAEEAPGAWELNEAMLTAWNPEALSHNWTLPDNFHVQVKVMGRTKETVHFLDQPFDIYTKYNGPQEQGRSLGANMVHSIDGMIVREMSRRCDYDINRKIALLEMLDAEYTPLDKPNQNDEMVSVLWAHYKASNYLSARVLDHLAPTNVGLVDRSAILELLLSMPDKPFKVISVHDCFRCLPHYGNDLRKQYNLQLALIARSNMLSYLISQIIGRPIQLNKIMPRMDKLIEQANYALS